MGVVSDYVLADANLRLADMKWKLDYIHENPVRAGWVEQPEDYLYSNAKSLLLNVPGRLPLADWYS